MNVNKGNIVKLGEKHGIILAVTKDGTRAKCYVYGPDVDVWRPMAAFTVVTAGSDTCYKCGGSGLYYMGGAVLNGRYTGKTGECYGCIGKGTQTDDDRVRCHYYWHRQHEIEERIEAAERGDTANTVENKPLSTPLTRPLERNPQARMDEHDYMPEEDAPAGWEPDEAATLIDCKGCGTLHRNDTMCPW